MINSTKIRTRKTGTEAGIPDMTIEALATLTEINISYEAPIWTGTKELWCAATALLEGSTHKVVALEIDSHKYKVSLDHRFLIIRTKATRDRENETYPANDSLAWIKASDMRIGDRLYFPAYDNIRKDWNKQDKQTGLGFVAVNKLRVQDLDEPVQIYRLNVSRYHHFMMPSGIISGA
jgi:hypothetical protein